MQKEMVREIEDSRPKFIVLVKVYFSWLTRPNSEKFIFGWLEDYTLKNYYLVGVVDMISPELTVYRWGPDAEHYTVQSPVYVLIFERR
jgi:hypothetical protein